ncbi:hypothetical protein AYI68_g4684, partial [Smittium mucronatum]
MPPKSEIPCR